MRNRQARVCPVAMAASLDNVWRRWLQNPYKILAPYVHEGMTVLDFGCGPGFFTIPLAHMVGARGHVIAADLQDGMLRKVRKKISGTAIAARITLHCCDGNEMRLSLPVDFVLLFYVVHELPNKDAFFKAMAQILRTGGQALIVEPPLHVSQSAFERTLAIARVAGFTDSQGPKVLLSKSALLRRCHPAY